MRSLLNFVFPLLVLILYAQTAFSIGSNSLPAPKALPILKALPKSKALPSTKSLPVIKSVPKSKKLPIAKALPTPRKLVLKPVFEPSVDNKNFTDTYDPIFDPRFDQPPAQPMTEDEKVTLQQGIVNFTLDTISKGDIRIVTNANFDTMFVWKQTFITALDGYLMPEIFQQIDVHLRRIKWLDIKQILSMGFDVDVDIKELIMDIGVPAKYREMKTKKLGGTVIQTRTIDINPSSRSMSVTPYWSRIWSDKISTSNFLNFDTAINYDGWVLESDTAYDLIRSRNKRKTTRLVRDFPEQVTRVTAGDVEYKTIGLMGRKPLGGMSISREFSLKPNLLFNPMSHQRIFLENDSTLRIFINGIPRQVFSLRGGYYDLQDFPFIDGLNFVKIEITDIYGKVTIKEYMGFDNKKVLVPGITDYSITAGFERLIDPIKSTSYDFTEPAFSGFVRRGVSKNITLGVLSEGDNGFVSVGAYGVATSIVGTFEASSLQSFDFVGNAVRGTGVNLNYYFATSAFTFVNTAYFKSEKFSYLGENNYSLQQKYFGSSSMGFPVPFLDRWRQTFSARYQELWDGQQEARASFELSGRMSKNFTLSGNAFYSVNENRRNTDKGASLTLRWYPQKRISIAATYDSQFDGQQIDFARGPNGLQGVGLNGSVANNKNTARLNGGINWKTQYFDTRYNIDVSQNKDENEKLIQDSRRYETFTLTSSFAYVDGEFAMGPPIKNGSFVIFKSGDGLGRGRIAVSQSPDSQDRESMPFLDGKNSTALYTNLNQYGSSTAYLLPYLEDGFIGLEKRQYRIFSKYRSGALVTVTKDIKLYGSGVISNKEWEPISLVKGTFVHSDSQEKIRFFTDEEGYFEVENLTLGKYRIYIDNRRGFGEVEVKTTKGNTIDFGILNLEGIR